MKYSTSKKETDLLVESAIGIIAGLMINKEANEDNAIKWLQWAMQEANYTQSGKICQELTNKIF